jgi:hypothetical protein
VSSRDADRDAIEALRWRYDRALDTFNADAHVALYTQDGSFGLHKMMTGVTAPVRQRQARPRAAPRPRPLPPPGPTCSTRPATTGSSLTAATARRSIITGKPTR